MKTWGFGAFVAMGVVVLAACASSERSSFGDGSEPTGGGSSGGGGPVDPSLGPGGGGGPAAPVGTLTGTVKAPNGSMPIAGALVYLTHERPAPNPGKVYCDGCVHLAAGTPYAVADASGQPRSRIVFSIARGIDCCADAIRAPKGPSGFCFASLPGSGR